MCNGAWDKRASAGVAAAKESPRVEPSKALPPLEEYQGRPDVTAVLAKICATHSKELAIGVFVAGRTSSHDGDLLSCLESSMIGLLFC